MEKRMSNTSVNSLTQVDDPKENPVPQRKSTRKTTVTPPSKISTRGLNFFYGAKQVLFDNNLEIPEKRVTAIIGPSGCGKSTHIRVYNKIFSLYREQRAEGEVILDGINILSDRVSTTELRRKVGMIFQKPTPFPLSVFENVAYGLRLHYKLSDSEIAGRVENALKGAALWEEVRDVLNSSGTALSGGQQQRLCITRALAINPEVILMDEPCSALDPVSSSKIEDLMFELKERYTIIFVTHNMQQAARVSDFTAFLEDGRLVEFGETEQVFTRPKNKKTEKYVTGRRS